MHITGYLHSLFSLFQNNYLGINLIVQKKLAGHRSSFLFSKFLFSLDYKEYPNIEQSLTVSNVSVRIKYKKSGPWTALASSALLEQEVMKSEDIIYIRWRDCRGGVCVFSCIFRISRGGKFWLATSAYTKGAKPCFFPISYFPIYRKFGMDSTVAHAKQNENFDFSEGTVVAGF